MDVPVDAWARLIAGFGAAAFGLLVVAGQPRKFPNRYLGFFLLLIAGNQLSDALAVAILRGGGDPAAALPWMRLARVFAALDPLVLYYFASIFPVRNSLNASPRVASVMAGSIFFVTSAGWAVALPGMDGAATSDLVGHGLGAFTVAVYLLLWMRLLRAPDLGSPEGPSPAFYVAMSFAAVPIVGRPLLGLGGLFAPPADVSWWVRMGTFLLPFLVVAATAWVSRSRRIVAPPLAAACLHLVAGASLFASLLAERSVVPWSIADRLGASSLSNLEGPLRWLLFGAFMSVAVLRHQMVGLSVSTRRGAARGVVAGCFVGAAGVALLLLGEWGVSEASGLTPFTAIVLGVALAASQSARSLVDRVASRMYGVPVPGDLATAIEAYRRAASQAAVEGRSLEADPALGRLRDELGLDERASGVLGNMIVSAPAGQLVVGQTIAARYHILQLLGRGGAGKAFLAQDGLLGRHVVIKEVLQDPDLAAGAAAREASLAMSIDHPNVVKVHDVLHRPGEALLVLEYVSGGSLADRLARHGPLSLEEGLRVMGDVLAGLEAIHARGIVHRDLKPANILLAADGSAKITDFGIAKAHGEPTLGAGHRAAGTPEYMAPEVRRGMPATTASDVYAVGLLLERAVQPPLPKDLARLARKARAPQPGRRWRSAAGMGEALAGLSHDSIGPHGRAPGHPATLGRRARALPEHE